MPSEAFDNIHSLPLRTEKKKRDKTNCSPQKKLWIINHEKNDGDSSSIGSTTRWHRCWSKNSPLRNIKADDLQLRSRVGGDVIPLLSTRKKKLEFEVTVLIKAHIHKMWKFLNLHYSLVYPITDFGANCINLVY